MSVFYGVRLTDELSAKIEATGKGKTEVITAALEAYFGKPLPDVKVEKPQTGTAALMDGKKRETIKPKRETKPPAIETTKEPVRSLLEIAADLDLTKSEPAKPKCRACKRELEPYLHGLTCFNSTCHRFHVVVTP